MKLRRLTNINPSETREKTVLIRVDYNLPLIEIKGQKILDDFKVRASLTTIQYLLRQKVKIILISHFKDPGVKSGVKSGEESGIKSGEESGEELSQASVNEIKTLKKKFSLRPVASLLEKILKKKIKFLDDCLSQETIDWVQGMKINEVVLLENLRFYPGEKENDPQFAFRLSQLADFYINDAFAVSHREHSSVVGILNYLPSAAGFSLTKEIEALSAATKNPKRPLIFILGGAKITTKIKLIKEVLKICDYLLIGGALANEVLKVKKMLPGKLSQNINCLDLNSKKIILPEDMAVLEVEGNQQKFKIKALSQIQATDLVLDIGPKSCQIFKDKILAAKTIIWNGPLGFIEEKQFSIATKKIALAISQHNSFNIVGGGETVAFINSQIGLVTGFNHISTGGGAMLSWLSKEIKIELI